MCVTVLVMDTPDVYQGEMMQAYIEEQRGRVDRKWVERVLAGEQETDSIRLQTDEFVVLPDTRHEARVVRTHKARDRCQWGQPPVGRAPYGAPRGDRPDDSAAKAAPEQPSPGSAAEPPYTGLQHPVTGTIRDTFSWVAFVRDTSLRTIRDLRGHHVPMLRRVHTECVQAARLEHGLNDDEVMVFANYPPSVYTLHFHVCRPFKLALPFDAFRLHSLLSIIHHLEVDPEYYTRYNIHVPVNATSRLYRTLTAPPGQVTLEL